MKTLILGGSPRKHGDTAYLIERLISGLDGKHRLVNAYDCDISACVDCRYCRENPGCDIDDEMQQVYGYIQSCDNIVIASPLHFSELSGRLLCVGSRLQTYFCARFFRGETPVPKPKRGGIILAGGNGKPEKAAETARILLHDMNCYDIHKPVCSLSTDKIPASEDTEVLRRLDSLTAFLNEKR